MCDGVAHCPWQEDELLCDFVCPDVCVCHGLAFVCYAYFVYSHYPQIRQEFSPPPSKLDGPRNFISLSVCPVFISVPLKYIVTKLGKCIEN